MILALATPDHQTHMWLFPAPKVPKDSPDPSAPVATSEWESGRALSDQLLGRITAFLAGNAVKFGDLQGIVILSGPGSFTSLRIGHTVANALADSLSIPIQSAQGEDWLSEGLKLLSKTPNGVPVLPHYGAEANITRPKS